MSGNLILLTLPIGNLKDLTFKASDALKEGENFIAEDTRNLKKLMNLLDISLTGKKFYSFHDHSSQQKEQRLVEVMLEGKTLYLTSDAGTPVISDPAYPLIKAALAANISVDTISGVSSLILGLELSGFPTNPFCFLGFVPTSQKKRSEIVQLMKRFTATFIFFESPKRLAKTLIYFCSLFPQADFCVARELTKKFQSVHRFKGREFSRHVEEIKFLGEMVLLISLSAGSVPDDFVEEKHRELAQEILKNGNTPKLVAKLVGHILKREVKEVYDILVGGK